MFAPSTSGNAFPVDQSQAPLLDALADYHRRGRYGYTPPGHGQGRSVDERVLDVLGVEPFRDDVLASGGLDDRKSRGGFLSRAEDLMADAVGAGYAFFSTCGSSLSVKAAMMAVAGGGDGLLVTTETVSVGDSGRDPRRRLNDAVVDYLRSGLAAGMNLPDATDPSLDTFRVVA